MLHTGTCLFRLTMNDDGMSVGSFGVDGEWYTLVTRIIYISVGGIWIALDKMTMMEWRKIVEDEMQKLSHGLYHYYVYYVYYLLFIIILIFMIIIIISQYYHESEQSAQNNKIMNSWQFVWLKHKCKIAVVYEHNLIPSRDFLTNIYTQTNTHTDTDSIFCFFLIIIITYHSFNFSTNFPNI